jgi:hypothetical protein
MISTALNPMQCVSNSLIPFWQTRSIWFLLQSVWKVVCGAQIQRSESQKLPMNGQCPLYSLAEAIPQLLYIKFYNWVNTHGNYADGFYNSMIDDNDRHVPSPLIVFICTASGHALLE